MLIRVIRRLPAPQMDGFDVRHLRVDAIYTVDAKLGRYLIVSEYAVRVDETADDDIQRAVDPKCANCRSMLVLPQLASGFAIPATADYVCLKCQRAYRWDGRSFTLARVEF